jgi:hypothetical protein
MGVLYGITTLPGAGVVLSCAPPAPSGDGWSETTLYGLPSGDGPDGLVMGLGGVLYG